MDEVSQRIKDVQGTLADMKRDLTRVRHIAVLTPHKDERNWNEYSRAIHALDLNEIATYWSTVEGLPYDMARNRLVERALEMRNQLRPTGVEIEGIVWVDDDVVVPRDFVQKLLAHNKPMVSALYFNKRFPFTPQMYRLSEWKEKYWPILDWPEGKVVEADACGFGAVWTSFEVIDAIQGNVSPFEWFKFTWPHGEDFYFCELAKAKGYKVLVDTSIICDHISVQKVNLDVFKSLRLKLVLMGDDGKPYEGAAGAEIEVKLQ